VRDEKFQYEQIILQIFENLIMDSEFQSRPIKFVELSLNNKFRETIKYNCGIRKFIIITYEGIAKMISELIVEIEIELKR
jgi:hypothetical protein